MTERIDFDAPTGDEIIVIRVEMVFPDGESRRLKTVVMQAELDEWSSTMPVLVAAKARGVATILQRNLDKQAHSESS